LMARPDGEGNEVKAFYYVPSYYNT
jgi:hypothetical protein